MTKTVKLYDVATISTGNSAPQDEKLFEDGVHNFVRTSDVGKIRKGIIFEARDKLNDKGILKLKIFPKGTILFPKSGASTFLNHRVMLGMDAYVSSHLATIKGDSTKVLDNYLLNILQTIDAANLVADSNYPSLKTQTISEIDLVLPSIQEQHHIVAKLDAAFTEINNKEQLNLKKLDYINRLKKSTLDSKLGNNLIKLSEACDLIKRGISPKYLETGGVAVINQKCIRNHKIDYSKTRRHDINLKKVPEERFIKKGDVLINSTGHGTLGRVAQVNQNPVEKTTVDSHVTIIRPKQKLFNLGYFGNALIKIEKQLEAAGEGTSGQTELSRSKLENEFFIPFMDSIEKQKKVSLMLNSMFENTFMLQNLIVKIMENLKSLKLSFLHNELNNKKV